MASSHFCIILSAMGKNMNPKSKNLIQTEEKEMIRLAQSGDFKAFTHLIEGYRPKIFGLALKLSKNREDAEDIFQETFLKAIDNIKKFRAESSFGTWLYTICVNVVRAKYGRDSKGKLLPIEDYLPAAGHGHEGGESAQLFDWNDPLSKMTNDEIRENLDKAIHELPLKYRLPFLLRYTQEMSFQEVADTLNLKLANAKSRILRARLALRQTLSEYFSEDDKNGTM
jgi:RNA polymerase sigma-70 factor (ECF subfamily)